MKYPKLSIKLFCLIFITASCGAIEPIQWVSPPRQKAPLQVWYVFPVWGKYKEGEKITIDGLGFEPSAIAFLGDTQCVRTRVKSPHKIRCTLPELDPGKYSVTVVNPDGTRAPLPLTQAEKEELKELARENEEDDFNDETDGLIYFRYVK